MLGPSMSKMERGCTRCCERTFTLTTAGATRSVARTIAVRRVASTSCAYDAEARQNARENTAIVRLTVSPRKLAPSHPRTRSDLPLRRWQLVPVRQKSLNALIRQRMLEQHVQHLGRHGCDMRSDQRRLDHVHWMPHRGNQDFGFEI